MGYILGYALVAVLLFPLGLLLKHKLIHEGQYDKSNKNDFKENIIMNLVLAFLCLIWPAGIIFVLVIAGPELFEELVDWWFESRQKEPNADA